MSTSREISGNHNVSTLDVNNLGKPMIGTLQSSGRQKSYFACLWRRPRRGQDEENATKLTLSESELPAIPSALEPKGELYSTPLPIPSMIVLSIVMLGEFLSANVSTPFILFMVKGFGELADEADIAFWTGILVASFFLTQFLTSLLWSTMAAKYGQRNVLFLSLLGSAVTCLIFGISTSLRQAIVIRLLQGVFAGAVGVARGCVTVITDLSNEGRAYAILGFCWGFGGLAGAIIGGAFESPALKWPGVFDKSSIIVNYPYLLPCAMAASITFTGSVVSLFLARDAGPQGGAILLPSELPGDEHLAVPQEEPICPDDLVDEPDCEGIANPLRKKVSKRLSGSFVQYVHNAHPESSPRTMPLSVPLTRTFSLTSRADGSMYGRSGSYRRQLAAPAIPGIRRPSIASSMRWREPSVNGQQRAVDTGDLNLAQRLLMANENAVTNIADLWVAAAMNSDMENPFQSDSEAGSIADRSDFADESEDENTAPVLTRPGRLPSRVPSHPLQNSSHKRSSITSSFRPGRSPHRQSISPPPGTPSIRDISPSLDTERASLGRFPYSAPVIFTNPGVCTTTLSDTQQIVLRSDEHPGGDFLAPIIEGQPAFSPQATAIIVNLKSTNSASVTSQLPVLIIIQYGLLALHTTTHDQVFMSYLVSEYRYGGLSLNAGHFAQLLGLMCLAQLVFQFYLYPNFGPPRGRLSHLAMFRLGTLLFIPAYISVALYRVFASPTGDRNFILMTTLAVSTAVRYCGNTFAFTAISILLNYMTPPHAVGFANGFAQSIVSLSRVFGPVLGGYLWATSTQDNPSGYPIGFLVCGGVAAVAIIHSILIR